MSELIESLNSFQHRSAKLYLAMVVAFAVLGILLILFFPILSLLLFISAISSLFTMGSFSDLIPLLYQLPLAALSGYLFYQFVTLELDTPKASGIYITINKKKTPKLIALIEELEQHFNIRHIDSILITDQFDISVHNTPQHCIPQLGQTSLQIGLPLMQSVSATQFKALLARRIGQLSLTNNKITGRISLFQDQLQQYLNACQYNPHWALKPFFYLIRSYQKIFTAIAFYVIRMEELTADQYALDIIDDDDFSQTLSQTIIASHYLKNTFWVSMYKLQRQYPNKMIFPHANMAISFAQSIKIERSQKLIEEQFQKLNDFYSSAPLLRTRLYEIGYENYKLPEPFSTTAAQLYLDSALPKVTRIFDKLWLQRLQTQRETNTQLNSNEQRLNLLASKIQQQPLSADETWEFAVLTEKITGYHAAIPIYKKILERNPMHAKAMFAIGRILLSYNDPTGLDALNKAIFLEPTMQKTADELIARYQTRVNATPQPADEMFA